MSEKTALDKTLDSPVGIEFESIHLAEIAEFLSDSWTINLVIDWRAVAHPPRPKPAPPQPAPAMPSPETSSQPPEAPPKPGPDRVTDGIVPYIKLKNVSLRDALAALLRPLNLTSTVDPHLVWISSPALIEADARHPKPLVASASENMAKVLQSPAGIEFESIHVREILEFISDSWDVNIMLDSRVVRPPTKPNVEPPLGSPGYVTDGMVPYINLVDIPVAEALDALLRPLNLTFKADKDVIWISSYDLIDAPPLRAQEIPKPSASANPRPCPLKVDVILLARDGQCLARVKLGKRITWFKEGDAYGVLKLVKIDPKAGSVSFREEKPDGGTSSTESQRGVINEAELSAAASEQIEPNLRALRVRAVNGRMRVEILSPAGIKHWYDEGDKFEAFEVLRIDPSGKTVLIFDETKNAPLLLSIP